VAVKLLCITHNRDQPPLKSTLFQLQVYANIRSLKISKWDMCIQLVLDLILDKDKYKLSLEFDAILGGLSILDRSIAYMPSILAFLKLIFSFLTLFSYNMCLVKYYLDVYLDLFWFKFFKNLHLSHV